MLVTVYGEYEEGQRLIRLMTAYLARVFTGGHLWPAFSGLADCSVITFYNLNYDDATQVYLKTTHGYIGLFIIAVNFSVSKASFICNHW